MRDAIEVNERSMMVIEGLKMEDTGKGMEERELEEVKNVEVEYERKIECLQSEKEKVENDMKVLLETHEKELKKA